MGTGSVAWPYAPTLARLALALGLGLFIGIERERRRKEAGLRTFAFAALLGGIGGLLDDRFAMLALGLLGVLVILLNVETIHTGEGAEITTSAALLVTGFIGVLAGKGHTFTPTALGVATAGLLAWKEPLAGFSRALTESEFRSAVLLAIVAFVVYPVLPAGSVDPWRLVDARAAWVTVILIAALGFLNYLLLKL
ncbi:MAG: MgtC/SapB family protein, partial [bacterium]